MSEIVTVAGRSVQLRPVSNRTIAEIQVSVRRKALHRGDPLTPPKYVTVTVAGEKQEFEHDATTLETDEDKEKWAAYRQAVENLETETTEATTRYMLSEGVAVDEIPEDWLERREWLGLETPEHRMDRKLLYIETELLTTPADQIRALQAILHLSAKGSQEMEARLEELDDLFRRALEGTEATA